MPYRLRRAPRKPAVPTNSTQPRKAALYARVSTEAQYEEGYSIDVQKRVLEAYCQSKQIERYEFYIDGGFSGSNTHRPEMERMIRDIEAHLISHVIVYKLDRLSRSQKDTLHLIEDVFFANDVSFSSVNESFDTSNPQGKATLGMLSVFAQLERETIRERTRMGMLERIKEGYWPGGGRVPTGYRYDKISGTLIPNEDAPTVVNILNMYLSGYSPYRISQMLGIPEANIRPMITRKTYAGLIEYKGACYKGRHQPLVSMEMHERLCAEFKRRGENFAATKQSAHLLSGLLICGKCGAKMRYQKWGDKVKILCYSHQSGKKHLVKDPNCPSPLYNAPDVEAQLFDILSEREFKIDERTPGTALPSVVSTIGERLRLEQNKLKRLYAQYSEGDPDDILLELINQKRQDIKSLSTQYEAAEQSKLADLHYSETVEKLDKLPAIWPEMSFDEKRAFILDVVDSITLTGDQMFVKIRL